MLLTEGTDPNIFLSLVTMLNLQLIHPQCPLIVCHFLKCIVRTSLVVQWLRICLPMLGTRV